MAKETAGSTDPNLSVDEFYVELRTKAEAHPDATVITGYILESNGETVRISSGLNSHVEVNTADILASHKLPAGGTVHFINPKARVTYAVTSTATAANFLTGPLTSAYLGSASSAPGAEGSANLAGDCGKVLTTLACTLAAAQAGVECKQTLWTAGCTFAAAQAGVECKQTLWTAGCTFAAAQAGNGAVQCGHVLTTLACTLAAEQAQAAQMALAMAGCKDVMWTAGCTFAAAQPGAGNGAAQCGHVLTTLACTLAAAQGQAALIAQAMAGCKDVMWTAGCTFAAAQPGAGANDCKNVMWTAGCTFNAAQTGNAQTFPGTTLIKCD